MKTKNKDLDVIISCILTIFLYICVLIVNFHDIWNQNYRNGFRDGWVRRELQYLKNVTVVDIEPPQQNTMMRFYRVATNTFTSGNSNEWRYFNYVWDIKNSNMTHNEFRTEQELNDFLERN